MIGLQHHACLPRRRGEDREEGHQAAAEARWEEVVVCCNLLPCMIMSSLSLPTLLLSARPHPLIMYASHAQNQILDR